VSWKLVYTKQAQKDAKLLAQSGLKKKAEKLFVIIASNPYQNPLAYEKLMGDLAGAYFRRMIALNIMHF
jgi:Txe/YoeB family toxin of Txe-Axe toxin-antitoxin module